MEPPVQQKFRPLVSVILPVYNGEDFIEECLESIYKQTYKPLEVIIIDDGSTDRTSEILEKHPGRKKVIHQQNRGVSNARNVGIGQAAGEFIAFTDYDDLWLPEKIEKQVNLMQNNGHVDLVFAAAMPFFASGAKRFQKDKHKISLTLTDENLFALLSKKNLLPATATMARKQSIIRAGLFDESFKTCGDYELWLRMAAMQMKFRYLPEALTLGRKHGRNISMQTETMHMNRLRAIQKTFALPFINEKQKRLKRSALASVFMFGAHTFFSAKKYQAFLTNARKAVSYNFRIVNLKFITRYSRSLFYTRVMKFD